MNLNFKKVLILSLLILLISNCFGLDRKKFVKSLILPGWGEKSSDSKSSIVFLANEILLWSSKYYFNNEADLTDRNAINYARQYAHIPREGLTDNYYSNLETYMSAGYDPGGFNHIKLHEANELYGEEYSDEKAKYLSEGTYPEELYWSWDSKANRSHYIGLRNDERDYKDLSKVMTGVIIVNHLASAINTVIIEKFDKNKVSFQVDLKEDQTTFIGCNFNF